MSYYRRISIALTILAAFPGCQSSNKPAQSTTKATRLFAVKVDSAGFFQRGPRQGQDPDLKLPRDTVVKLIRPSFGFSKIQIVASGVQGYIASEEIGPVSSSLLASAPVPPVDPGTVPVSGPTGEQFNLNSSDPRLVPPPEELPDPDLPAPAPEP